MKKEKELTTRYVLVIVCTGAGHGSRVDPAGGGAIQGGSLQQEAEPDGLL